MKDKILSILVPAAIIVVLMVTGYYLISGIKSDINKLDQKQEQESETLGYSEAKIVDVIGTETSPYSFEDNNAGSDTTRATTTGIIFVGNDVNVLNFDLFFPKTSSTPPTTHFYVMQSNDADCTTTTEEAVNIEWVDVTPITTTAKTASTSYELTVPHNRFGVTHQITNWNALCAKIVLGSASSTAWVSASKQSLNN